jgi:hypothetical protein
LFLAVSTFPQVGQGKTFFGTNSPALLTLCFLALCADSDMDVA